MTNLLNKVRRPGYARFARILLTIRFANFVMLMGLCVFLELGEVYGQAPSVENLKHGVVRITATNPNRIGTGVIVGVKGQTAYIATASHVIEGDPSPQVTFYQDHRHAFPAQIQGMDGGNRKGLAALVVEGELPAGIRPLVFHSEGKVTGGEKVTVIGFPRLVPVPWAVTEGTITGLVGPDLVFTGPVEEGNSGGPLLLKGKVVGLITEMAGTYNYAKPAVIARYELENYQLMFTDAGDSRSQPVVKAPTGMVLVKGGTFEMGSLEGEGDKDEHPLHAVTLDAFYLDTHEVTNQDFQQFVEATGYPTTAEKEGSAYGLTSQDGWKVISGASWLKPEGDQSVFASGRETHPVVSISWEDAKAYCTGMGKRLPTEAEWEYAARADTTTNYWWGQEPPRSADRVANLADKSAKEALGISWAIDTYDDGYARTAPVGSFKANPWGLYDMSGNVWEWVADWFAEDYYQASPKKNPQGPSSGDFKALRGGSWDNSPSYLRSALRHRSDPSTRHATNGVRCAQDAR